jgi:hypothetical protein
MTSRQLSRRVSSSAWGACTYDRLGTLKRSHLKARVDVGERVMVGRIVIGPSEVVDDEQREHSIDQAHVRRIDGNEAMVSARVMRRLDMHDRRKVLQEIVDATLRRRECRDDKALRCRDKIRNVCPSGGTTAKRTGGALSGGAARIEGCRFAIGTCQPVRQ